MLLKMMDLFERSVEFFLTYFGFALEKSVSF